MGLLSAAVSTACVRRPALHVLDVLDVLDAARGGGRRRRPTYQSAAADWAEGTLLTATDGWFLVAGAGVTCGVLIRAIMRDSHAGVMMC